VGATIANVEMAEAWNGPEGDDWAREWEHYDRGVRDYHLRLLEAAAVSAGERVLDLGCGIGQVSRDLAAQGADAVGIDLSRPMLAKARELAQGDVDFVEGDAQVHPFPAGSFDVVVSRFGCMFFADRVAAFTNVARATRPGGRLALLVWQPVDRQEWLREVRGALALGRELPAPPLGAPGPFGMADPDAARAELAAAGWADVAVTPVQEDFWAGADPDDAMAFIGASGVVRGLLESLSPAEQERGRAALRDSFTRHAGPDGVLYGSACWLYTATRAA
jgi:SAM-dependent methyltransferase